MKKAPGLLSRDMGNIGHPCTVDPDDWVIEVGCSADLLGAQRASGKRLSDSVGVGSLSRLIRSLSATAQPTGRPYYAKRLFSSVAGIASSHEVVECIESPLTDRDHVIDFKVGGRCRLATVTTCEVIPLEGLKAKAVVSPAGSGGGAEPDDRSHHSREGLVLDVRLAHPVHTQLWLEVPDLERPEPTVTVRLGCRCGHFTEVEVNVALGGGALAAVVDEASRRLVAFENKHRCCGA